MMYGDPLPIHFAGNCSSKNVQKQLLAKCGGGYFMGGSPGDISENPVT